jgi:hypothetical protein
MMAGAHSIQNLCARENVMKLSFIDTLVARGAVSNDSATIIRRWVSCNKKPIGMIAVEHGLINGHQIDDILDRQKRGKKKFGELAVEMGLLDHDKVVILLQIQRLRAFIAITEVLALAGIMPLDEGFRAFREYLDEQGCGAFELCETVEAG